MRPGDVINRKYTVVEMLPPGGKSQTAKVTADGRSHLFLKLFTGTLYPFHTKGIDPAKLRERKRRAEVFERRHVEIMRRLNTPIVGGGNLVKPLDFFRLEANFFKVYPFLRADKSPVITRERTDKKILFFRTFLLCLNELHSQEIVHSDIKPDNLLVERKPAGRVAKLIDFDEAYLSGDPPDQPERLGGDERFYSPELHLYKTGRLDSPSKLTTKSDIFAAGLLMHEIGAGKSPEIVGGRGDSAAERMASGATIRTDPLERFPAGFGAAINQSLSPSPRDRPNVSDLLTSLGVTVDGGSRREPIKDPDPPPPVTDSSPSPIVHVMRTRKRVVG